MWTIGCLAVGWAVPQFTAPVPLQLADTDRILVLAPHPEDEGLGCVAHPRIAGHGPSLIDP